MWAGKARRGMLLGHWARCLFADVEVVVGRVVGVAALGGDLERDARAGAGGRGHEQRAQRLDRPAVAADKAADVVRTAPQLEHVGLAVVAECVIDRIGPPQ